MPFGLTNAPAVFQRLMQRILSGLNPDDGQAFVSVYMDDVLIFSRSMDEHLQHLREVFQRIKDAGLKLNLTKCKFIRQEIQYLGHIITSDGLKTNPKLIQAVQNFPLPTSVRNVRQFLGLCSYYRRFIHQFAAVAQPLHMMTRKNQIFHWDHACQRSFDELKQHLTSTPILAYPVFGKQFILETDASILGIGAVLSQVGSDNHFHPIAYASHSLTHSERNYGIIELETLAVVWAMDHFRCYLYGQSVVIYTDHSAVKAVLKASHPTGKHARWWTKLYGSGTRELTILHCPGKTNSKADALSRNPYFPAPAEGIAEAEIQVATLSAEQSLSKLLLTSPLSGSSTSFGAEQRKDVALEAIILFIEKGKLPEDPKQARKVALQSPLFAMEGESLKFVDSKRKHMVRFVVPVHLRNQVLDECHRGLTGGHFSGKRTYAALSSQWWWEGMYADTVKYVKNCPECAIVSGGGHHRPPPLHPIPVQRPFQIIGVDIMDLPKIAIGNKHVIVFQDYLTKWPMVYPVSDQKARRIAEILVNDIILFYGVPECLLSDRGTNLLSHLMIDIGMVERFNRTLKTMLRKHAGRFGSQWDRFLPGVLWAYQNTPHDSTGEKPSFLLFGIDLRSPAEAAFLPTQTELDWTDTDNYREEIVTSLSSARLLAAESIKDSQRKYKEHFDRGAEQKTYRVGDLVLIRFPQEEEGPLRKLSRPWHGPYRIVAREDPDVTVVKMHFPQEGQIQVHQSRVSPCPAGIPPGYFWYGSRHHFVGRPPKWVQKLMFW